MSRAIETRPPAVGGPERRGRDALLLFAICTAVGVLFATHFRTYHQVDWPMAFWWGLKEWYLWGALVPVVVFWTRRLWPAPVWAAVAGHLAACAGLILLHTVLSVGFESHVEGLGDRTFPDAVRSLFVKKYGIGFLAYAAAALATLARDGFRGHRSSEDILDDRVGGGGGLELPAENRWAERLLVRESDRERFVPVDRIERIEAEGNYVRIHAAGAAHLERRTLKSVEEQLDPARFLRIHRSHLVHVESIDRIEPRARGGHAVVLRDGTSLPLSRSYRKHLEKRVGHVF